MKWQLEQLKFSPLVRLYDVKTKENQQTKTKLKIFWISVTNIE